MAAERGAGQQQSQEMMEGERPPRAAAGALRAGAAGQRREPGCAGSGPGGGPANRRPLLRAPGLQGSSTLPGGKCIHCCLSAPHGADTCVPCPDLSKLANVYTFS